MTDSNNSDSPTKAVAFESLFNDTSTADPARQYAAGARGDVDEDAFGVQAASKEAKAAADAAKARMPDSASAETRAIEHSAQQAVDEAFNTAQPAVAGFLSNLWWALLLALFVPVRWERVRYSWLHWTFFVVVCLIGPTAVSIGASLTDGDYQYGLDLASFSGALLPLGLLMMFAVFVSAAFVTAASRRGAHVLAISQAMAMALAVIELVRTAIYAWLDHPAVAGFVKGVMAQVVRADSDSLSRLHRSVRCGLR
jgi:hypothetical protein